ncbi:MAG TPA: homoserine dehydrogenase [Planctomycetaceae bacterium]|nr:homoserine dehydrogenase [Planctomycetaceae bacterium]
MAPLKVAVIGVGTIGTGVCRVLLEQAERLAARAGRPIQLVRAVDKDVARPRPICFPEGVFSDDLEAAIQDPTVEVAVELIGGVNPTREIVLRLLESGKHVVTANKALLAECGDELFRRARQLNRCIAFEAAVAGGIPIIRTLGQAMAASQITSIEAILNGTSNFILTEMLARKLPYTEVLREAQDAGYAEADPTLDVDGTDAAQKLAILVQLAFGTRVSLESFPRHGIDALDLADLQYADELGYTVKLLAVARLVNGQLEMYVQPTLLRRHRPLANIGGALNMVALEGDVIGRTWYAGPGAGQMPTASAVTADIVDIAIGRAQLTFEHLDLWQDRPPIPVQPEAEITRRFYLRFNVEDRPHVLADIADVLGREGISIASVIQHEAPEVENSGDHTIVPLVIMTHRTTEGKLQAAERKLAGLSCLRPPHVRMPVAD